jgi:recombinational DNA repair protein RecT
MSAPIRSTAVARRDTPENPYEVNNAAVGPLNAPLLALAEKRELKAFVTEQARAIITPLLRSGDSFERVLSEVWLAIQKNPELADCTSESLLTSTARILSWGLVIGEGAFLAPFNVKVKDKAVPNGERWESRAQAIRGYQGVIQLVVNAGAARSIDAKLVYANEIKQGRFKYVEGSVPRIEHEPILIKAERGECVGAYARAIIDRFTPPKVKWMDLDEIDAIRQKHSKSWKTRWEGKGQSRREVPIPLTELTWYIEKTPILQLCKTLPKSPKLASVLAQIEAEDAQGVEIENELDPANRIAEPSSEQPAIEYRLSNGGEDTMAAAPADDFKFPSEKPEAAEAKLEGAGAFVLTFSGKAGTPIGELSEADLAALYAWAKKQKPTPEYTAFIEAAEFLMEERRLAAGKSA